MRHGSRWGIVVLAAVAAAGCSGRPDDAALVTRIKSEMFSDSQLKGSSLQVTSRDGQITLSGTVSSDAARLDAYKIATQTPGVTKVNDQMTLPIAEPQPEPVAAAEPETPAPPPPPARPPKRERHVRKKIEHSMSDGSARYSPEDQAAPPAIGQPVSAPAIPADEPAAAVATPVPPPPQPQQVVIPANTTVTVRMIDSVDPSVNQAGEIFHASLENPVVVDNQVVVPRNADVYVRLVSASKAGRFSGKSELSLELVKLEFQGQSYPLVSTMYSTAGQSQGKSTAKKVGGGAVLGAIIGAIAGGGKGAAIGATAGAGAGGVYQGAKKNAGVKVPSETKLDFQLQEPVTVTVMPRIAPAQ